MTDTSTYCIVIPAVPPSGNVYSRLHWTKRMDLIAEWFYLVSIAHASQKWTGDVVRFEAVIYFKEKRRRDIANWITTLDKMCLDHIVSLGVIPDDDSEHVPEWRVRFEVDKDNPRTEVTLIPIS
jgi:hypothetical protein